MAVSTWNAEQSELLLEWVDRAVWSGRLASRLLITVHGTVLQKSAKHAI
jgi:hypothetical protein